MAEEPASPDVTLASMKRVLSERNTENVKKVLTMDSVSPGEKGKRNAFDIMFSASRKVSKTPEAKSVSKDTSEVTADDDQAISIQNLDNQRVKRSPEISCMKDSASVEVDSQTEGIKSRLRKRPKQREAFCFSPEDENRASKRQKVASKRRKHDNPKESNGPKIMTISDDSEEETGKSTGKVPSMFLSIDVRKANKRKKEQEMLALKKEEERLAALAEAERKAKPKIVLPESIAPVTAKQMSRIAANIIELESFRPPSISHVNPAPSQEEVFDHLAAGREIQEPPSPSFFKLSLFHRNPPSVQSKPATCPISEEDAKLQIMSLREKFPDFNILKYYKKILEHKNVNNRLYTELYGSSSGRDMIGLKDLCQQFSDWLDEYKRLANQRNAADDDSDEEISDSSRIAVVVGPTGIGKTSFVHSIAQDLEFNVIEISTNQCRSSGRLKAQLKEGSLSHKMSREKSNSSDQSVILIDDGDVILPDDTSYTQALVSLSSDSRKPLVITTSNPHFVSSIKTSYRVFAFPADRSDALRSLLESISLSRCVSNSHEIINQLISGCDFRAALINLQLFNSFSRIPESSPVLEKYSLDSCSEISPEILDDSPSSPEIGGRIIHRASDSDDDSDSEICNETPIIKEVDLEELLNLRDYSRELDGLLRLEVLEAQNSRRNLRLHAGNNGLRCNFTDGDTERECRDPQFAHINLPGSNLESVKPASWRNYHSELAEAYPYGYCEMRDAYCERYPYIGLICQQNSENKKLLQMLDSRRFRRHCHYLDDRNFGFSNDLKNWIERFYKF